MKDALRGDYINSLPQPFFVRFYGAKDWWWPVYDIGIDAPIIRIDVCGMLERKYFLDVAEIKDASGVIHNPDDWWNEDETP